MAAKVTSVLARLIEAIENARLHESKKWRNSKYFKAIESCLEEANELLQFELTRASTQQESHPKVNQTISRRVTRQSAAEIRKQRISLPDEVLNAIFSYFKDTLDNPTHLSSNAYKFSLVCKSWHRAANRPLWQDIHLSSEKSTKLFARSLYERHQSPTRAKGSQLSIGDDIRGLHVHASAEITLPTSYTYVFDCVKLFTRNIVSLNLKGLSTDSRPMKITEFYEILKFHPHLKHVWLDEVDLDSTEPLDPLPQFETFDCGVQWEGREVETLELISAKAIEIDYINIFKTDAVKSVYFAGWTPFHWQVHEFKQVTHLYLHHDDGYYDLEQERDLLRAFNHIVQELDLSFLVLDKLTFLASRSFDLIAEHCSLTTFVINWQPHDEDSIDSLIALIEKMGPKLLSVGVGLEEYELDIHPRILQAICENCPNLMTLELYGFDSSTVVWSLEFASELENLCRLPLQWIYAPWFKKWPKLWEDTCPKFAKLCRLGLNVGLGDFLEDASRILLDHTQPIRPAMVGDGSCSQCYYA